MKRITLDKVLYKRFKIELFPRHIYLYAGNSFKEALELFEKDFNVKENIPQTVVARCNYNENYGVAAIILDINSPELVENIYHESLHAAGFIVTSLGLDYSFNNDEMLAYLQGHISKKILSFLKITYTVWN